MVYYDFDCISYKIFFVGGGGGGWVGGGNIVRALTIMIF